MRALFVGGILSLGMALAAGSGQAETLFKYKGKAYDAKQLPPAQQQQYHDLRLESYMRMEAFVDQALIELYLDEESAKTGKSRDAIEENLFNVGEPSDKEVSEWYEANKTRLPPGYKLEQIAGDIKNLLKGETKKKKRDEFVQKLRKDGKLELGFSEPQAPIFQIPTEGFPAKGSDKAKVTLVEFADYQCPHCRVAGEAVAKMLKKYDGKVRLVFIDYPINPSGVSLAVAQGAVCADQQGKYWPYHDLAFQKQRELTKESPLALAKELKLDEKKFKDCVATDAPAKKVAKGRAEGDKIGITGTPALFINGQRLRGHEDAELDTAIKRALGEST